MLKTYFERNNFSREVKPCIPPHTLLIILKHSQDDCQLKNSTDFQ